MLHSNRQPELLFHCLEYERHVVSFRRTRDRYVHIHPISYTFYFQQRVPFSPLTVQMPNLALVEIKQITVYTRMVVQKSSIGHHNKFFYIRH